jgi:hypothetical protein
MPMDNTFDFSHLEGALDLLPAAANSPSDLEVQNDLDAEQESCPDLSEATTAALNRNDFRDIEDAVRNLSRGVTEDTNKQYMR